MCRTKGFSTVSAMMLIRDHHKNTQIKELNQAPIGLILRECWKEKEKNRNIARQFGEFTLLFSKEKRSLHLKHSFDSRNGGGIWLAIEKVEEMIQKKKDWKRLDSANEFDEFWRPGNFVRRHFWFSNFND